MAKNKFRSGFRYNNSPKAKGHLTYVYAQDGSDYKYLGITHSKKKGHHTNYPLKSNPNPNDARKSYVRKHPEKDMKKYFGDRQKNFKFSSSDYLYLKKYMK